MNNGSFPYFPFQNLSTGSRLLVAFSGGIDSSVSVHLCREQGFEPEAVFMNLLPNSNDKIQNVMRIADKLGVKLHILDLCEEFRSCVMQYTWNEFNRGKTPNPCAVCNPIFKFGHIAKFAQKNKFSGMVTGHYARIIHLDNGMTRLYRGTFLPKDQSYFLFGLSPLQLSYSYFPLGAMSKDTVREIAIHLNLPNAHDEESQDTCFSQTGISLAESLRKQFHGTAKPGLFIEFESGKILGRHNGIHAYTIGQRKGTGVAMGVPAYIRSINAQTNVIEITKDPRYLDTDSLMASNTNWILSEYSRLESFQAMVQIRYRSKPSPATVIPQGNGSVQILFQHPQHAVTPGQAVVFYTGDMLIGGAWIQS